MVVNLASLWRAGESGRGWGAGAGREFECRNYLKAVTNVKILLC